MFKFLFKYGPGSPGDTLKKIIELYNYLASKNNKTKHPDREILELILAERIFVSKRLAGNCYYMLKDYDKLFEIIEKDICAFTFFVLYCESKNFRKGVSPFSPNGQKIFNDVIDVLLEVGKKKAPLMCSNITSYDLAYRAQNIIAEYMPLY